MDPKRAAANTILEWTFFHLVKEVRNLGYNETPKELPEEVRSPLIQASLGSTLELTDLIGSEEWLDDWVVNARAWVLTMTLKEAEIEKAKEEIERSIESEDPQFSVAGIYAARNLNQHIGDGGEPSEWLETYEGIFAPTFRLFHEQKK